MGPVIGLILVVALTTTYVWSVEKNNSIIMQLIDDDLILLNKYTDLFTELSQNHMALYKLLYDAPKTEEGIVYDRGQVILDNIRTSNSAILRLSEKASDQRHLH
ncbi:MAG: hypothetical protein KAU21_20080, partial [Gammaproteobacteria bacterium]|nr:hypothetical protein [Gammaproteobacteria bacterium]